AEALLGWQSSEIRGRRFYEVFEITEAEASVAWTKDRGGPAPTAKALSLRARNGVRVLCAVQPILVRDSTGDVFQIPYALRTAPGVDVGPRIEATIGRRRFLREHEELALAARASNERRERVDDVVFDLPVPVDDEEFRGSRRDAADRLRDGVRPVGVRRADAGRAREPLRERFEVGTRFEFEPHRVGHGLRERPAERGFPHPPRTVHDGDGGGAGEPVPQERG